MLDHQSIFLSPKESLDHLQWPKEKKRISPTKRRNGNGAILINSPYDRTDKLQEAKIAVFNLTTPNDSDS
jgi:hypothetical protein